MIVKIYITFLCTDRNRKSIDTATLIQYDNSLKTAMRSGDG